MNANLPIAVITQQLMRRTIEGNDVALPFARDIFLLETHIAGLVHYHIDAVADWIAPGLALSLRREPANPHDELAIEIFTTDGFKLGYVPRQRNAVLGRLMDAGKLLLAEIAQVGDWHGQLDVRIKITLRDL